MPRLRDGVLGPRLSWWVTALAKTPELSGSWVPFAPQVLPLLARIHGQLIPKTIVLRF